jgi:hypothetical protein
LNFDRLTLTSFPTRRLSVVLALALSALFPCSALPQRKAEAPPSKDDVLNAIGHKQLAQDPNLQFQIASWNARPDSFVALVNLSVANDSMYVGNGTEIVRSTRLQPTLVLLQYVDGRLVATAQSDGLNGLGKDCRQQSEVEKDSDHPAPTIDGSLCQEFDFDLAHYRITPTETAIGIRTKYHDIYAAGEGDYEDLTLFDVAGHKLTPIFSEIMNDSSEERGPNEMNSSKATLQISAQQTRGHFDLVLVEKNRTEALVDDPSAGHPSKGTKRRRFAWSGSAYVEAK